MSRDKIKERMRNQDKQEADFEGKEKMDSSRNVVIFTGRALIEIFRD